MKLGCSLLSSLHPHPPDTMRPPLPLLALAALLAAIPAARAQSRCVTYFVAAPNAPFSYKAGFTKATWPKDCDPAGVK